MLLKRVSILVGITVLTLTLCYLWNCSLYFHSLPRTYQNPTVTPGDSYDIFFKNEKLRQDDPSLLKYIRTHHLIPPSSLPYNLKSPYGNPSAYPYQLRMLFREKRNGFFIECGANDGEFVSNTLALERDQNWSGLLIEANKLMIPDLISKNRKAWIAPIGLSIKPYPEKVNFLNRNTSKDDAKLGISPDDTRGMGLIDTPETDPFDKTIYERDPKNYISTGVVECFPLFSILSALNVVRVDYFSLDVEGVELKILQTIPFEFIYFDVISVEWNLIPEGKDALVQFMESKGFQVVFETVQEIFFRNGI